MFNIWYVDPPWSYSNKNTGGSMKSGASNKYPVMSVDSICNIDISRIKDPNSVLFLWVPNPLLPWGLRVMDAWGFKYKTTLVWDKERLGMGFWFRGQTEFLLFGVCGNVAAFRTSIRNIHKEKSTVHSKKPDYYYSIIEDATDGIPYRNRIELFATSQNDLWTSLGYGIDGIDINASLMNLEEW